MTHILGIVGSASRNSANEAFLELMKKNFKEEYSFEIYNLLQDWPLFTPEEANTPPPLVTDFKRQLAQANIVLIATPEYSHNIPAVLKNMLEWVTASGEFMDKKVIPITFTPQSPRGEYAMKSLINTLQSLKANILIQVPLFRDELGLQTQPFEITEEVALVLQGIKSVT